MWWYLDLSGGAHFVWHGSVLSGAAQCMWQCCGFVIGGLRLLVTLLHNLVVMGAHDPRSQQWSHHATQRCGKVGEGRYIIYCMEKNLQTSYHALLFILLFLLCGITASPV